MHSCFNIILMLKHDKNYGRCRWQREKRNGRKFSAQLRSRESGLDSKQPKKPCLEILQTLVSRRQNVEPRDKVVCKLCKLQSAYHSTTSNMRAHMISKLCTQTSMPWCLELQLNSHISTHIFQHPPPLSAAWRSIHEETCFIHMQGYEADQYFLWHRLQRVLSRIGTEVP